VAALEKRYPRESFTKKLERICQRLDEASIRAIAHKDFFNKPATSKVEITSLWVVGSYARGAMMCGDLDLVLEYRVVEGQHPSPRTVFLIPAGFGGRSERSGVKNRDERLVILNSVAKSIIEKQRGQHKHFVFPFGMPDEDGNQTMLHRMNDSAWKRARIRATKKWLDKHLRAPHEGFTKIRVHDLKHTFGRRLRAAGVTEEDRKALLGHKNGSITSHYSAAELDQLIEAANKVSVTDSRAPALTILKRRQA